MNKREWPALEQEEDFPAAPHWMVTYGDMVTLILAFFVLLVSISSVENQKFKEMIQFFRPARMESGAGLLPGTVIKTPQQARRYEELLQYLNTHNLSGKVEVNLTESSMHIAMSDSIMFRSGEANLIAPADTILRLISRMVDPTVKAVIVEGHTDNRPISNTIYASNWELSGARAASVVRFLINNDDTQQANRYYAVGCGEHHPIDTNTTPAGRAHNRRVEILFSWEPWQNDPNNTPIQPRKHL